ncbi:DUF6660 family protein [Dyadobacter sp.]|uniref:DUF6660 family protein n=1 Tax=Dyadobacter sp. TaxID=1914288 RepID=UPI003F7292E0
MVEILFVSDYLLHVLLSYFCNIMRLALYILAFYTVILSCIPCQDEVLRISYAATTTTINANADHQDQGIVDLCSPFCICACCAGITLQEPVASLPEVASVSFFNDDAFTYTADCKGGGLASIWQPPRI